MSFRAPVQPRGGGFGLDAELARKAAERYDYDMENEARAWLEAISEMPIGDDFGEGLRDGVVLCTVANKIHAGVVKRVETKSKMPFKLMENVSAFLKACRVMGVNEFDLFETVDLFELKDLGNVVRCVFALGRAVQRNYPDFKGPTLGVKESIKNQRSFTPDQLADGKNIISQQTLGSFRTMKRYTSYHTNNVMLGADAAQSAYRAPPPPPPPSKEKIAQLSRFRSADKLTTFDSQPEGELSPSAKHVPTKEEVAATVAELSEEVEKTTVSDEKVASSIPGLNSVAASSGPTAEEEAQEWIEAVLGEKFLASFADSLKDGVILCTLMNKIQPGLIPKIQTSTMPFKQMENVSSFVRACRTIGVAEFDLFETVDLYNQKNIGQVVQCIHALGRTIQKTMPEYDGPRLGVKESTVNPRQFTEAQLREAKSAVPVLAHGSQSVMERLPFDHSASVTFRFDTAAAAAAAADASSEKKAEKPEPMTVESDAQPETTAQQDPTKVEKEVTPASEPVKAEDEAAPSSEDNEKPAKSTGPSWLAQRVASLNSVSTGSAAKPNLPVGGSSSVLPTRTVWS
ncbi:IQ motif containing GTPase activating protein [Phytophthora cinnamomi]|uniref:IQ motif containing GTPase activating protein n=1 Tax=Phytophthora cinnamomi TaxID=4785 RepID=UPI00355940A3|nr:IQ motif containing GTPase activating protein [Phytophthora cinnamomi]